MRSRILTCLFVVAITPLIGQSLSKANTQFDLRDYEGAVGSYMDVLHNDDTASEMEVCARIAQCYVQLQDNLHASQWYEKIIEDEGVAPEYVLQYAHVLKSLRLYGKAKFYYQKYAAYDREIAQAFSFELRCGQIGFEGPGDVRINEYEHQYPLERVCSNACAKGSCFYFVS